MGAGAIGRAAGITASGIDNAAAVADDVASHVKMVVRDDLGAGSGLADDLWAATKLSADEVANARALFERIKTGDLSVVRGFERFPRMAPTERGFLMSGTAGTGKTSVIDALAATEKLHVKRIVLGDDAVRSALYGADAVSDSARMSSGRLTQTVREALPEGQARSLDNLRQDLLLDDVFARLRSR